MDKKLLSDLCASYIDFNILQNAIDLFEYDKKDALEEKVAYYGSRILDDGKEADLYNIIIDFLQNFRIPRQSIYLVNELTEKKFSKETLEWFENYKFNGIVRTNLDNDFSELNLSFVPLIVINSETVIIDIIMGVIDMIIGTVELFCLTWKKIYKLNNESGEKLNIFYEPNVPSEFLLYIEHKVIKYYDVILPQQPGESSSSSKVYNGYRYVAITAETNIPSNFIEIACKSAEFQASQTLKY